MEVNILNCSIKVQDLYDKVSKCGSGSVSLFVGNRKDVFERSVLGTVTGCSRNHVINAFLTEVCREVREKHSIENITVYCWLDAPGHEPCIAIACLASNYLQASEAVNAAVDLISGNKLKSNYNEPVVDVVSADLIQVKASCNEINQRINSFIERRRDQVNKDNIRDFCCIRSSSDDTSCARVDAVRIHRKDSSSHLRVRKVFNTWGPQTKRAEFQATERQISEDNLCESFKMDHSGDCPKDENTFLCSNDRKELLVNERLQNVEDHIGLETFCSSSSVHARLKKIEDKILYLEGLSPEYFECGESKSSNLSIPRQKSSVKKSFSTSELSKKIKELECNVQVARE